jgi:hypothetical protein
VHSRVPTWLLALLAFDRNAQRLSNLRHRVRDELLLAWTAPKDRAALTAALYADQSTYLPGGRRFQSGLFAWEKAVIDGDRFPRSGRVLVGAAGAGREAMALIERGFSVLAFDPCEPFVAAARAAAPADRATFVHAAYDDLVAAVAGRGGPLAEAVAGPPFDAVILGWGSLSHVLPERARAELLHALRRLAPAAPVLASFFLAPDMVTKASGKGRVQEGLRRLFRALGAPSVSEIGDQFTVELGFFSNLFVDDVVRLASDAGYEVAVLAESPFAHALFVPRAAGAPPIAR